MPRQINREHILQVALVRFVREAVSAPHEFMSFDRGKAAGQWSHMREKARGVKAGTPDVLLLVEGRAPIWCELKAPGNKPTEQQIDMGNRLMAVGCWWSWVTSVSTFHEWIRSIGVELRANAEFLAMHADAGVLSKIATAETKAGKPPRSYKAPVAKPSAARLRKVAAVRDRVRF
jgi:VRR-NUC domain